MIKKYANHFKSDSIVAFLVVKVDLVDELGDDLQVG